MLRSFWCQESEWKFICQDIQVRMSDSVYNLINMIESQFTQNNISILCYTIIYSVSLYFFFQTSFLLPPLQKKYFSSVSCYNKIFFMLQYIFLSLTFHASLCHFSRKCTFHFRLDLLKLSVMNCFESWILVMSTWYVMSTNVCSVFSLCLQKFKNLCFHVIYRPTTVL